jgi:hypothetical protein
MSHIQTTNILGRLIACFHLIQHKLHRKLCDHQFFCCCLCIHYNCKLFTELLPSNGRRMHMPTQLADIHKACHWEGLMCHGIHAKLHKDWCFCSKFYKNSATPHGECISSLFFTKEGRLKSKPFCHLSEIIFLTNCVCIYIYIYIYIYICKVKQYYCDILISFTTNRIFYHLCC